MNTVTSCETDDAIAIVSLQLGLTSIWTCLRPDFKPLLFFIEYIYIFKQCYWQTRCIAGMAGVPAIPRSFLLPISVKLLSSVTGEDSGSAPLWFETDTAAGRTGSVPWNANCFLMFSCLYASLLLRTSVRLNHGSFGDVFGLFPKLATAVCFKVGWCCWWWWLLLLWWWWWWSSSSPSIPKPNCITTHFFTRLGEYDRIWAIFDT